MPWNYTEYNLLPDEAAIITTYAKGRALEFGSGGGIGTHALLAGRIDSVLSIDEDEDYIAECEARFTDPRIVWLHKDVNAEGWYDHGDIQPPGGPPPTRYSTIILDGPAQYPGRAHCLPMLLEGAYLAPKWQILVTRTALTEVKAFLDAWSQKFPIRREALYCLRGIVRITPMTD